MLTNRRVLFSLSMMVGCLIACASSSNGSLVATFDAGATQAASAPTVTQASAIVTDAPVSTTSQPATQAPQANACSATTSASVAVYDAPSGSGVSNMTVIATAEAGSYLAFTQQETYGWYQVDLVSRDLHGWVWQGDGGFAPSGDSCGSLPAGQFSSSSPFDPVPNPHHCYFYPYGDGFSSEVYDGPQTDAALLPATITEDEVIEVLATSENRLQVQLESGAQGWVPDHGVSYGSCDALPFVASRAEPPADTCAIYFDYGHESLGLHADSSFDSAVTGDVPIGEWITALAYTSGDDPTYGWYQVQLSDGSQGWVQGVLVTNLGSTTQACANLK
jgi:hypothetical protein